MYKKKLSYRLFVFLVLNIGNLFAQKSTLNLASFDKWTQVGGGAITNNGNYVLYAINNQPIGNHTLIIQATSGDWKVKLPGIDRADFTADSRKIVFMKGQDTLCLIGLGSGLTEYIPGVAYYRLFKQGKAEILAIQKTSSAKNELLLCDLTTNKVQSYPNVGLYVLSDDGKAMVVQRSVKNRDGLPAQSLDWVDLVTGKILTIWQGKGNAGNFVFDTSKQFAFTVEELINKTGKKSIWLYRAGAKYADRLEAKPVDGTVLNVDKLSNFSKDGTRLFLKLKQPDSRKVKTDAVKVDVWSYTDPKLQAHQLKELEASSMTFYGPGVAQNNYAAVIDVNSQNQIQLEYKYEYAENLFNKKTDNYLVIKHNQGGDNNEDYWNKSAKDSYYLVVSWSGERKLLSTRVSDLSPNGQYALGTDQEANIFSYELVSGNRRDLTRMLPTPVGDEENDVPKNLESRGFSIAGWLSDSRSLIIYDKYDIWQLDASGTKQPVNLTNGYGRKQKIVFRLLDGVNNKIVTKNQQVVLTAFNTRTKENGFYQMIFGKNQSPEMLTMDPYVYHVPGPGMGSAPLKAKDADIYMVQRESSFESPNYFLTKDFKSFRQLSAVYPESEYNWMRSELVNFKALDGRNEQGALYKPADFDPNKKYPVIIHYYERKSDLLNSYHIPEAARSEINIPWFVSQGYLVFTPDIHYTIGKPGESALNTVVGAANYLKALRYVDGEKMGIQGHSFGGFETNYIVTHTNIFAAALASAGPSNLISFYNDLWGGGNSKQESLEMGQLRIGRSLWEQPDLYLKNSPILKVDQVNTPLLMVQNKEDGANPFHQGVEFFTALRRLGKRVWMLQYDGQGHNVLNKNSRVDYTIRMTQFFDHYLKGAPAPLWMLHGIPAKMKGIDDGLALDTTGATPGPGLLIEEKKEPLK